LWGGKTRVAASPELESRFKAAMKKRIYLANPYGFSRQQKGLLRPITRTLEALGLEVWEPFARNNQVDFGKPGWAYEIGQRDYSDVRESDGIFAIVNGTPPDEGVMVELGMAIALGKPTFLFRDDFRRCTDSEAYPLNLMLFTGLPKDDWRSYFYESVREISRPDKALAAWAASKRTRVRAVATKTTRRP
jgi:nucleoside 2-deoxyribosyltransferase